MDLSNTLDLLWVIVAGILVFFMQAGFTLLEAGFTRAKNTANIAMKNIVDLFIGAIAFWAIGYSLMYGNSISGFIGTPSLFYIEPSDMHNLFYQTVFCATAATIISGAIAERAKFSTYVIFTFAFTTFIYPIAGHWIWQTDGWLTQMGFIDFAGSTAVHVMGGFSALIYALLVGARNGKYNADGSVNHIKGHNNLFAVLGVFILWMGWFGFNAGSTLAITGESTSMVPLIILNTNLAAAAGGLAALFVTWIKYKKADISMTLNGTLAGLVGITAGCAIMGPVGAMVTGCICGIAVSLGAEFVEKVLKVDDAVASFSVHGIGGVLGTLLVGIFSTENGILYGGGFEQLKIQAIGVSSVAIWAVVVAFIAISILKYTVGIRVPLAHEIAGLDNSEHNIFFDNTIQSEEENPNEFISDTVTMEIADK
ncbi:ammonium transporter [Aquimarina agarilytica]|uniref:ammonium transporter n=1 Tax=Aquimarina agarilytica TaxID=1087449 RepID=UPI0002897EC0|nr:ammonium transporter [Aquimarina agarilytica]